MVTISQAAERYQLEMEVGHGGTGTVYQAYDNVLNRTVALKLLHPELLDNQVHRETLIREVRLATAVAHPNVVRVYDITTFQKAPAIIMQYVAGESLQDTLDARGALPVPEAIALFEQIVAGAAAAHRAGVVHGDLKPQNVLIGATGGAYITDFGVACCLDRECTPGYSPPEFRSTLDSRYDVYSLGLILLVMLVGVLPACNDITADEATSLVPRRLRPIIRGCLARDPQRRYADANELYRALTCGPRRSIIRTASMAVPVLLVTSGLFTRYTPVLADAARPLFKSMHEAPHVDVYAFQKMPGSDSDSTFEKDLAKHICMALTSKQVLRDDIKVDPQTGAFHVGAHTQPAIAIRGRLYVNQQRIVVTATVSSGAADRPKWETTVRGDRNHMYRLVTRLEGTLKIGRASCRERVYVLV